MKHKDFSLVIIAAENLMSKLIKDMSLFAKTNKKKMPLKKAIKKKDDN